MTYVKCPECGKETLLAIVETSLTVAQMDEDTGIMVLSTVGDEKWERCTEIYCTNEPCTYSTSAVPDFRTTKA